MDGRQRRSPEEEPAVTFELEGARAPERSGRLGAAGGAAAVGAGLISGGGVPDVADSLDVFDQLPDEAGERAEPGEPPVTSYDEIMDTRPEDDFPPLDFRLSSTPEPASGAETLHGATSTVGGGFALDGAHGQEAIGAQPAVAEPVDPELDGLVDAGIEGDAQSDEEELDEIG